MRASFGMKLCGWLDSVGADASPRQEVAPASPMVHPLTAAFPLLAMTCSGLGQSSAGGLSWLRHIALGRRELLRTAHRGLLPLLALSYGLSAGRVSRPPLKAPMDEAAPWDSTTEVPRRDFLRKTWEFLRCPHASASTSSNLTPFPPLAPGAEPDRAASFHPPFARSGPACPGP
jgi:hypothetical protein